MSVWYKGKVTYRMNADTKEQIRKNLMAFMHFPFCLYDLNISQTVHVQNLIFD